MIEIVDEKDIVEVMSEPITTELDVQRQPLMSMEKVMELGQMLSKSTIIPVAYQNYPENCIIAVDMANRMGLSPIVVMQNLYVIQGKPSWSGQAMASMIRNSKQFKNVELHYIGTEGEDSFGAYVTAIRTSSGQELVGSKVTIGTAKKEGWYQKSGSKWQSIPSLMLAYRAYAFFGRVYAPELLMGLQSVEEVNDAEVVTETVVNPYEVR